MKSEEGRSRKTPGSLSFRRNLDYSFLWIILAAIVPVSVLYLGHTGSDFEFHLSSWQQTLEDWRSGVVLPSWASHANFYQGEPRFLFYPPLSFFLGASLYALAGNALAAQAFVFVSLVLAGFCMRAFAAEFLKKTDATFAAVLYVTSYYLVVSALIRFAAAEVLSAALLPLLFKYLLRVLGRPNLRDAAWLALCFSGVWLADIPAAIGITYMVFFCGLIDLALRRQIKAFLWYGAAQAFAFVLIAWYLIPALAEKKNIAPSVLLANDYRQTFLFADKHSWFWLTIWAWTALGAALALAGIWNLTKAASPEKRLRLKLLAYLTVVALFFQTPISSPLWAHLPQLGFVQFTWRLDVILGCIFPVVFLAMTRRTAYRIILGATWLLCLAIPMGIRIMQQRKHHPTVTAAQVKQHVQEGYDGIPEYAPAGSEGRIHAAIPQRISALDGSSGCSSKVEAWLPESLDFQSSSPTRCSYQIAVLFYADWAASLDGKPMQILHPDQTGLIVADVPPGVHDVRLHFNRFSRIAILSALLSLAALIAIFWALRRHPNVTRQA